MPGSSAVVLGIDGGGTKTTAILLEVIGRTVVGTGTWGASNMNSVGERRALEALDHCTQAALRQAGRDWADIVGICACMSGVDTPADRQAMAADFRQIFVEEVPISVYNDALGALASGTGGRLQGCVLIAGTGTIAYGIAADGAEARASGWGPTFLDGGSGYDLGQRALAAVARAADGRGPPTALRRSFGTQIGTELVAAEELLKWAYLDSDWARIAALAPLVLSCCEEGDEVARGIVDAGVRELVHSIDTVAKKCSFSDDFNLVLSGGLLLGSAFYRERLEEQLDSCSLKPNLILPKVDAATGAALLALEEWLRKRGNSLSGPPEHRLADM